MDAKIFLVSSNPTNPTTNFIHPTRNNIFLRKVGGVGVSGFYFILFFVVGGREGFMIVG